MIDRHLTSEKLEEQFLSLPKDIQNAITSNAILDVVGEIGKNRGLHIDQTGVLAEETALLMLGETRLDGFSSRMEESLGVPSNIANAIVQDLNDKIFLPIRASLMTLHEKRATPQAPENMLATNMTPFSDDAKEGGQEVTGNQQLVTGGGEKIPKKEPITEQSSRPIPPSASYPAKQLPVGPSLVEQKLAKPFTAPAKEVKNGNQTAAQSAPATKIDPYRELTK